MIHKLVIGFFLFFLSASAFSQSCPDGLIQPMFDNPFDISCGKDLGQAGHYNFQCGEAVLTFRPNEPQHCVLPYRKITFPQNFTFPGMAENCISGLRQEGFKPTYSPYGWCTREWPQNDYPTSEIENIRRCIVNEEQSSASKHEMSIEIFCQNRALSRTKEILRSGNQAIISQFVPNALLDSSGNIWVPNPR